MTQKATVADFSPRLAALESERKLVRTIQGGTDAMRKAGKTYLPQHPAEGDNVYDTRLKKTFLDNFVGLAIDKAVGKIFAKPIKLTDLPTELELLCENIDRQGRDLHSFLWDIAKAAFEDGIGYVLAEKPVVQGKLTVAQEKAQGVRPYAVHIRPQHLLEVSSEMIGGVETLTRVRFVETVTEPDGDWGEKTIEQIRVLIREVSGAVRWQTYREKETGNKREWVLHEEGTTAFKGIYLVPFYTNRCGFMLGRPGFQRIAEANLEHWQVKSEFSHALTMQCFGMLTATGVEPTDQIEVGPSKVLKSTNPDAKFSYTEPTGEGIKLSADALKAIESRIETAGVNLRVENAGKVTATAATLDSEDTNAGLKAVAEGFGDSVEQLLGYFGEMMGVDASKADVEVNTDFGGKKGTDAGLTELGKLRVGRDLSREAILLEFQRRGELDPEFDIEADKEKIDQEEPPLGEMTAGGTGANTETV